MSVVGSQYDIKAACMEFTNSVAPVLFASYNTRRIVLVVQMPGPVCIHEHAIGIVHKFLGVFLSATRFLLFDFCRFSRYLRRAEVYSRSIRARVVA